MLGLLPEHHVPSLCIWAWSAVRRQGRASRSLGSVGLLGTLQIFPSSWDLGYTHGADCLPLASLAKEEFILKYKGHKIDALPSLWVRVLGTQKGIWPGFQGIVERSSVLLS